MEKMNSNGLATPFGRDLRLGLESTNNGPYPILTSYLLKIPEVKHHRSPNFVNYKQMNQRAMKP